MLLGAVGGRIGRSIWTRTPAEESAANPAEDEPAVTTTEQV